MKKFVTPENVILECLWAYPGLFKTKADVLRHLFFTNGNGYRWCKGHIIPVDEGFQFDPTPKELEEYVINLCKELHEESLEIIQKMRKSAEEAGIDTSHFTKPKLNLDKPSKEACESLEITKEPLSVVTKKMRDRGDPEYMWNPLHIYPICVYSLIMKIPDDITPEWLEIVEQALIVSDQLVKTKEDIKSLQLVKGRIQKIKESRLE